MLQPSDFLTLDLRGNPGGNLDNAYDLLGYLLPGPSPRPQPLVLGKLIVREPSLLGGQSPDVTTDKPCESIARRIIVLVDGDTASASEFVVAVLSECPELHVSIGGVPTFGKHVVDNPIPLPRNASLSIQFPYGYLTTPSGKTWDKKIQPTF